MRARLGRTQKSGGALLAVLWLSAALSAIAFTVATTVKGEVERSATHADGVKSYFLARGAIDRALLWMFWGEQYRNPDGSARYYSSGARQMHFEFPNGAAEIQLIPEASKLNVNLIQPEELARLLFALGVTSDERIRLITFGILDWRSAAPGGLTEFDQYYLSRTPSFRARHASMEEIEELLSVRGVTPELFHGTWIRDGSGKLVPRIGLKDCLSVYSSGGTVDVNSAPAPVLAALGVPPDAAVLIVETRKFQPFLRPEQLLPLQTGPALGRLQFGMGSMITLRSTARLRLSNGQFSDMRRTVAALVKFGPSTKDAPYHIVRWYDRPGLAPEELQ